MVKQFINENLNAQVEFSDVNLSFIRSFPEAQVNVTDLKITNLEPFKDETFATVKDISFTMSITELFKKEGADAIALSSNPVKLEALIGLDLKNNIYTFKENKGYINQLPIAFQGHVQLLEGGQDIDIAFENRESDFKNFLAVIPKAYSKNIEDVKTSGHFKVKGLIKGTVLQAFLILCFLLKIL